MTQLLVCIVGKWRQGDHACYARISRMPNAIRAILLLSLSLDLPSNWIKKKKHVSMLLYVAVFFFFHGLVCKWIYFYVFPRQLKRFNIVIVSLQVGRLSWGHGDNIQIQLVLLSALLLHSCQKQKLAFSSGQEVMAAILFHIFLAVFWVHFAQATGSLLSPKGVNYEGMTFKLYIQNDLALHNHVIC